MYAQTIKIRFLLVKCLIIRCSAYFELTILISIILKILHTFPKIEKKKSSLRNFRATGALEDGSQIDKIFVTFHLPSRNF